MGKVEEKKFPVRRNIDEEDSIFLLEKDFIFLLEKVLPKRLWPS